MSEIRKGDCLWTYSGGKFWPLAPDPKDVRIDDIACALSRICRFNGHTKRIYTVAEHCLNVEQMLRKLGCEASTCLYGLLHDSAEAYLCDITRPLKKLLPEYEKIEAGVLRAIYQALGVSEPSQEQMGAIKFVDDYMLVLEAQNLMKSVDEWALMETYAEDKLSEWGDVQSQFKERLQILLSQCVCLRNVKE